jgi:hypothetical protein
MQMAFTAVSVALLAIGLYLLIGPIGWAIWRARRWYRRSRRFTLRQLFFAFTIVTLLIGVFSLAWNM